MRKSKFAFAVVAAATLLAGAAQAQTASYAIDPTHLKQLEMSQHIN